MRIASISNLWPPYVVGGNEMLAFDVVQELRRRGHEVHVITGTGREFREHDWLHAALDLNLDRRRETFLGERDPTYLDLFKWHLFNLKSYAATRRALQAIEPQLVVVWNLYMVSVSPLVAASRLQVPIVTHACDQWLIYQLRDPTPEWRPYPLWARLGAFLAQTTIQPLLYRLADTRNIIANSGFIRDRHIATGFPPEQITVIHLGVRTDIFSCAPRPSAPDGRVTLLYSGSLWEGKGLQVALCALGHLIRARGVRNVHLDVYGEGPNYFKEHLRSLVQKEQIGAYVSFHGFVGLDQIAEACRSHDILVFPSIWDEPFSLMLVQAMSCGMAIVATSAGGTPEAICDAETGLLVPPSDPLKLAAALERLVADRQLRLSLGERAAARARKDFDFSDYVDRLESFYHRASQQGDTSWRKL